jgi:hypothetical protein
VGLDNALNWTNRILLIMKKHNSFESIEMTDGITDFTKSEFDATQQFTQDDKNEFISMLNRLTPNNRMRTMLENLNKLDSTNLEINLRINAIKNIYSDISNNEKLTEIELAKLKIADAHYREILIIRDIKPKAIMGDHYSKEQSKRAQQPRKLTEQEKTHIKNAYSQALKDGETYGLKKQLSRKYEVSERTIYNIVKDLKTK